MRNQEKTFSIKKLLLTILCTIIVSVFIGTTMLFVYSIPQWMQSEIITGMEEGSAALSEFGKSLQIGYEQIEENFKNDKELYGEDYPTEELFLWQVINVFSTNGIMAVYTTSVLIGIALGTIIYIVAIQNVKGKKLIIELAVAFTVLCILMILINLGYETYINKAIQSLNNTNSNYSTYIYDFNIKNVLIIYIIVTGVIYLGDMVRQRNITRKLNKELNRK